MNIECLSSLCESIMSYTTVVVFSILCIIVAAFPKSIPGVPMLDGRIVGGKSVSIEDYPHQLSLRYYGTHICGASVIGRRAALTAAHCTNGFSPSQLNINAGSSFRASGGITVEIESICQHPGYNPITIDKDVSIIILSTELPFNTPTIQPIMLPNANEKVPNNGIATVTGWGTLYSEGPLPNVLQKVDVPKVSDSKCKRAYGSRAITMTMICFGYSQGGKDACQGDSGGPIVFNGKQVGIVSWGKGCADPNFPGVYTDTAASTIANHIQTCLAWSNLE